jgi:hypothetical protein
MLTASSWELCRTGTGLNDSSTCTTHAVGAHCQNSQVRRGIRFYLEKSIASSASVLLWATCVLMKFWLNPGFQHNASATREQAVTVSTNIFQAFPEMFVSLSELSLSNFVPECRMLGKEIVLRCALLYSCSWLDLQL